jgi:hypothetical protein
MLASTCLPARASRMATYGTGEAAAGPHVSGTEGPVMDWRDRRVQMWLAGCVVVILILIAWGLGWFGGGEAPAPGTTPETR